jgi:hypothetical protein
LIASGVSPAIKGLGQYMVLAVMWVPALATVVTLKLITRESFATVNVRLGDWRAYVTTGWRSGLFCADLRVDVGAGPGAAGLGAAVFQGFIAEAGQAAPPMPSPFVIWPALFVDAGYRAVPQQPVRIRRGTRLARLFVAPADAAKTRAYLLIGLIWGAWHWPLVIAGYMYPDSPLAGIVMLTTLTTVFGIYVNEWALRRRSSVLAAWIHGLFNTQRFGVWALLFPNVNPWLGGFSGLIGIGVWLLLGLWESRRNT